VIPLLLQNGTDRKLNILCLGAHPDDIEIGCGGTVLHLLESGRVDRMQWVVCSGDAGRAEEARASAEAFLGNVPAAVTVLSFNDGYFPGQWTDVKAALTAIRADGNPDVIFTHSRDDAHQDHRLVCELTWNLWRNHLILEYEVPKYEGDLVRRNCYVPLAREMAERKVNLLLQHFTSQHDKPWFDRTTFEGLMRLRGVECLAPDGSAEAFTARKLIVS